MTVAEAATIEVPVKLKIEVSPQFMSRFRRFLLVRDEDESGISGTGVVAQGVVFDDGKTVMRWVSTMRSTALYDSIAELDAIHGHGGKTHIEWID